MSSSKDGRVDQRQSSRDGRRDDPLIDAFAKSLVLGCLLSGAWLFFAALSLGLVRSLQAMHGEDGLFLALERFYRDSTFGIGIGGLAVLLVGFAVWGIRDICRWLAD